MWLIIGGGMVTLLAAAMRQQKNERCTGISVIIKGSGSNLFIDQKDIVGIITKVTKGKVKGQPMSSIDLRQVEQKLEKNVWIRDAELYFDNNQLLHVTVKERTPVARIFTAQGSTFYIDSFEKRMPLSEKLTADLPVFTGFPDAKKLNADDSLLLHQVKQAAIIINNNPFWLAQVAQIDITPEKEMELIPVVGNHIVRLGKGEQVEEKFNRLFLFYKNVLSKSGFDKYRTIDVQYHGQVIGIKGFATKTDSIALRKSVDRLLQMAREAQNDTTMNIAPIIAKPGVEATTEKVPVQGLLGGNGN